MASFGQRKPPDPWCVFRGHKTDVRAVEFHPGGNLLLSGDADGELKAWDLTQRRLVFSKRVYSGFAGVLAIKTLSLSSGQRIILTQGRDGVIKQWELTETGLSRDPIGVIEIGAYSYCRLSVVRPCDAVSADERRRSKKGDGSLEEEEGEEVDKRGCAIRELAAMGDSRCREQQGGSEEEINLQLQKEREGEGGARNLHLEREGDVENPPLWKEREREGDGGDGKLPLQRERVRDGRNIQPRREAGGVAGSRERHVETLGNLRVFDGEAEAGRVNVPDLLKDEKQQQQKEEEEEEEEEGHAEMAGAVLTGVVEAERITGEKGQGWQVHDRDPGKKAQESLDPSAEAGREVGAGEELESKMICGGGKAKRGVRSSLSGIVPDESDEAVEEVEDVAFAAGGLSIGHDQSVIAVAGADPSMVELWSLCSGKQVLQLSQGSQRLSTSSGNTSVAHGRTGMCMVVKAFRQPHTGVLTIAAGFEDGAIRVWDARHLAQPLVCQSLHIEPILSMAIDNLCSGGVSGAADNRTTFFHLDCLRGVCSVPKMVENTRPGTADVAIRLDDRIAATGGWDHRVRVYDYKRRKPLAILKYHAATVSAVVFSPCRTGFLASASDDATVALWDIYPSQGS